MTTSIWKYPINLGTTTLEVPTASRAERPSAQVRHVGLDPTGAPCIWVWVDPAAGAPTQKVEVTIYGTGHEMPDFPGIHVGSFLQGPFVWHAYADR